MVNPGDSIEQVAKAMRTYRTDSAAVVDPAPRLSMGRVLLSDLFPVIISRNEMHGIVSDRMSTRTVLAAKPSDELKKVYAMITESGFSAFPVVKKTCLVGMISRRDLISSRRVRTIVAEHAHSTVEHAMTREVITISSCEPVSAAAELLVKHDISRLPVIDEGVLSVLLTGTTFLPRWYDWGKRSLRMGYRKSVIGGCMRHLPRTGN
jgi:CBS domain-containing protein